MTKPSFVRWIPAVLWLFAGAVSGARPTEVLVTREVQDLYRVAAGTFYIKTISCHENVFNDRAFLRLNISGKGGMLIFRNGHQCVAEKFLLETEASKLTLRPGLF